MTAKIDTRTATWQVIKAHIVDRIISIQALLESNVGWDETMRLRAQLKELRGILALAEAPEQPLIEPEEYLPS